MPETVAIQILPNGVLLARAKDSGEGATLSELVFREVGAEESAQGVAATMVRERGAETIGLSLLVNWDQYSLRDAWLPFTNAAQIRNTIKHELEDDLDVPADEAVMPFQVIEQRPEASHMLAWAAKKETLRAILESWENVGLSPEYMPPDAVGHLGLLENLAADLLGKPVVTVSGDERGVELTLIHERQIWSRRRLAEFSWAPDAAGQPLQEMRRTFLSVPGFPVPEAVVSFGGEAADTLAKVIAQDLECPQRSVAPPQVGTPRFLGWPAVAGVALLTAHGPERPLSFRIEEFEPKESGRAVSLLAVVATALLGVVMLVGGFMLTMSKDKAQSRVNEVQAQVDAYWKMVNLAPVQKPVLYNPQTGLNEQFAALWESTLQSLSNDASQRIAAAKARPNAIRRFRALCNVLTSMPNTITLTLDRVDITTSEITIIGKANSLKALEDLYTFVNERKEKDKPFTPKYDRDSVPQPDGMFKFTFHLIYTDIKEKGR